MRIGRHFLRESAEFGECGSGGVWEWGRRGEEENQVFDGEAGVVEDVLQDLWVEKPAGVGGNGYAAARIVDIDEVTAAGPGSRKSEPLQDANDLLRSNAGRRGIRQRFRASRR
jgi:hypothetical protein